MANTKKYVSLDKLGLYDEKIKKVVSDGDAAALQSAKDYADSLAANYDAAGAAATVQGKLDEEVARAKAAEEANAAAAKKAQDEVDALETVVAGKADQTALDALAGKVGTVPEGQNVMGIIGEIQRNAYDDTEIRGLITGLDNNKADKTQVATDIASAKTELEGKITTAQNAADAAQGDIDAFKGTYATDKAALEGAIALKADQTALDEVVEDVADIVKDYLVEADKTELQGKIDEKAAQTALDAEVQRATQAEAGLQTQINTIMNNPDAEGAINSINEFTAYVAEHGTIADGMRTDINKNKEDIAAHVATDHDFAGADAALKAELEGKINAKADSSVVEGIDDRLETAEGKIATVEGKVSTLEGKMTAVEGAVATKAEAQDLTDAIAALEGADAELAGKIEALEGKVDIDGSSVAELIETAKQEAIDTAAQDASNKDVVVLSEAQGYADELNTAMAERVAAVEAASATHALASDVTALAGRVTTAEGEIDTLQSEMDAVEALADAADKAAKANAAAIALKASQADLDAVSGRVTTLETWHENFVECSQEDINGLFA